MTLRRLFEFSRYSYLILILFSLFMMISCAGTRDLSYTEFIEVFDNLDTSPLQNKIIVIDPGHGGFAPGAVGIKGLTEKEINLNVGLALKALLDNAGANTTITRDYDTDLIESQYDSLRGDDLDHRIRISNETKPDLFISIHHNSNIGINRDHNATETYYKMSDQFQSFDAAKQIHRHMVTNIQPPKAFLKPGNYYVLRNNKYPAILGESSYISNPEIENRLRKREVAEFEAKSYFLGILDYFSRGVPVIESIYPENNARMETDYPYIMIKISDDNFGDGIDPSSINLTLNGEKTKYTIQNSEIISHPKHILSNGTHLIGISAANLKGNHTLYTESLFTIDRPAVDIAVRQTPLAIPPDSHTPMIITANVKDKFFMSVKDSTLVTMTIAEIPDYKKTSYTFDGQVNFYFYYANNDQFNFTIESENAQESGIIDVRETNKITAVKVVSENDNKAIDKALVSSEEYTTRYTNRDGIVLFENLKSDRITISKPGFYPSYFQIPNRSIGINEIILKPLYGGQLSGKKIFLDPEFGGSDSGVIGPTGLRAADENLETAEYLAEYLRSTGAEVYLSRERGSDNTVYSRVKNANDNQGNLFLSIRHGNNTIGASTHAYPTSRSGKALGILVGVAIEKYLGLNTTGPLDASEFVVMQTSSAALIVDLGGISNRDIENALYGTRYNRKEAYAIYTALLQFYISDKNFGSISGRVEVSGKPVENAIITIDESFHFQTGPDGKFTIEFLEPMDHQIAVFHKGKLLEQKRLSVSQGSNIEFNIIQD